jgi:hypothetical protein
MDKRGDTDNRPEEDRHANADVNETGTVRECVEKETDDRSTNPHIGEDPGLLESTEDPRERRLKRHTM